MAVAVSRKQTVIEYGLALPLAVILAAAATAWALVFDRQPPFDLTNGTVTPPAVREFETFKVDWQRRMLRSGDFEAKCTRAIVDSTKAIRVIDMPRASTAPGDFDPRIAQVPRSTAWGEAIWRVECCYRMKGISLTQLWPTCVRRPELRLTILPPMKP